MDDECVPEVEMRGFGSHPDPIDAVMDEDGTRGDDLLAVAAVVHDLRSAYERTEPLELRPELAELLGVHLDTAPDPAAASEVPAGSGGVAKGERHSRKPSSMLSALGALAGTLTGKVVLGAAVATASVGGLHTAEVVDVPLLPDVERGVDQPDPGQADQPDQPDQPDTTPSEGAAAGQDTADANQSAAAAYTEAVDEWTDCVSDAAAGQGDVDTRTTGGFDPREHCGDQPRPGDYGLGELPDQAADAAQDAVDNSPASGAPRAPEPPGPGGPGGTTPVTTPDQTGSGSETPARETPAPRNPASTLPPQAGSAPAGGSGGPGGPGGPGGGRP